MKLLTQKLICRSNIQNGFELQEVLEGRQSIRLTFDPEKRADLNCSMMGINRSLYICALCCYNHSKLF